MSNAKTTGPSGTDQPETPNGHSPKNGAAANKPDAAASVKKRKKKHPAAEAAKPSVPGPTPEMVTAGEAADEAPTPPITTDDVAASIATAADPAVEPAASVAEPAVVTEPAIPIAETAAPSAEAVMSSESAAPAAEPTDSTSTVPDGLRLRMKVWTDPATDKRYLMPTAFMRDVVNGQPVSDVMYAYAMRDDDTRLVLLRAGEWNALPFHYFQEVGSAPRASARPIDVVISSGSAP